MLTREQYIEVCKRCTKKSFDAKKGITCGLTNEIAEFESECPDFELNKDFKESASNEKFNYTASELINKIPKEKYDALIKEQNWSKAIIMGALAGIVGAIGWGILTGLTGLLIGFAAAGIGMIVSLSIRYAGKGLTHKYSVLGAGISLLSCFLGNLLAIIVFVSKEYEISFVELLLNIEFSELVSIYFQSMGLKEIIFYFIAIAEGVKFSIRPISPRDINSMNLTAGNKT